MASRQVPHLTLRQVVNEFLAEKRRLRGKKTTETYRARLRPILEFAERTTTCQQWPLAMNIDRAFVVELRAFLFEYKTTRNGRVGGKPKTFSARQVFNILGCLRSALAWAHQADVRKLPNDWANPLTHDLIGSKPSKDPLRTNPLPVDQCSQLVTCMDAWQLCQLSLSLALPLRPEEACGLLISDVRFDQGWLQFGTRLGGSDFNKGRQDFVLPFPDELIPILRTCIGGRSEGPLLAQPKSLCRRCRPSLACFDDLMHMFGEHLKRLPPGTVQCEQDRKQAFRRLLPVQSTGYLHGRVAALPAFLVAGIAVAARGGMRTAHQRCPVRPRLAGSSARGWVAAISTKADRILSCPSPMN